LRVSHLTLVDPDLFFIIFFNFFSFITQHFLLRILLCFFRFVFYAVSLDLITTVTCFEG
jgi:hypothetical protein